MWTFLNDDYLSEEKAVLHSSDLSIQRGYGIFDFFKVIDSTPVFLDEHLDRFYGSAEQMRLNIAYSKDELKRIISKLLEKNNVANTGVRITLTGGYSTDGYQLSSPNLIISLGSIAQPTRDQLDKGMTLITYGHQRQLPEVKTIDYLMAIWLQPLIKQYKADDVLYHQEGIASECPRSNFFIVTDNNKIITPSKNILKGVMRMKLIEVAKTKFEVEERELSIAEIKTAKEAFITSTTKTVVPVDQIDEYKLPEKNSVAAELHQYLSELETLPVPTT